MDRLHEWLHYHRWMALTAGVVLLCVYVCVGELIPRSMNTYNLFRQWQGQQDKIAAVEDWDTEQLALNLRKRQLQRRFAALYVSLPKSDHMSTILQVLQESADSSNVVIGQVRPTERVPFGTYDELPFEVEVAGPFHDVGRFINRIEQSAYVMKVKGLMLQRPSVASSRLHMTLRLSVIIFHEQGDTR